VFYELALSIKKEILGNEHIEVAMTIHELANVMNDSTDDFDFDCCYKLYLTALNIRDKKLGSSHRSVAATFFQLGRLFIRKSKTAIDDNQRQKDLLTSYYNLKNAFVIRATVTHIYEHKYTVAVLFFLGIVFMEMGRKNKAIVLFNEYQELSVNAKNDNTVKTIEKREQAKTYVEKLRQELINSEISRTTYTNNLLTNHFKSDDLFPLELHFSKVENNTENVVKINENSFANTFFNYENCVKIIQEIVHYTLSIVVSIEDVQQAVINAIIKNIFQQENRKIKIVNGKAVIIEISGSLLLTTLRDCKINVCEDITFEKLFNILH
jgi:hypothetical protein